MWNNWILFIGTCTYLKNKNKTKQTLTTSCNSEDRTKCNLVLKPAFQSNFLLEGGLALAQGVDPQLFRDCWVSSSCWVTAPCCPLLQPHKNEEHCSVTVRSRLITCLWGLRRRGRGPVGDSQSKEKATGGTDISVNPLLSTWKSDLAPTKP